MSIYDYDWYDYESAELRHEFPRLRMWTCRDCWRLVDSNGDGHGSGCPAEPEREEEDDE